MGDKNKYKEQGQKIEKSNNYGIYLSHYIDTNIRNERGDITAEPMDVKWIIRNELIYPHKFDNLDEGPIPRKNQSTKTHTRRNNLRKPISIKEIESIINNLSKQKS